MNISSVVIKGFSNISEVVLDFNKINSLIALNNYGKSNVIKGLDFGIEFVKATTEIKNRMMAFKPFIPYNKSIESEPFLFEINFDNDSHNIQYSYSFDWIKNDSTKGKRVLSEILKAKHKSDKKFSTYIKRINEKAHYTPSSKARCDKEIKISKDELVVNKISSFDDLFFLDIVHAINNLSIARVDTLQKPDELFKTITINSKHNQVIKNDYSLTMDDANNSAFYIYSLKASKKQYYDLLRDAVFTLLPSIEDFEPIEIDLKDIISFEKESAINNKLPLDFPEKIYDIRVREKNSNQDTSISSLSSGSQKLFYIISIAIAAEINNIPLVIYEELENSIHPGLLQKLLIILDNLLEHSKLLISSHSPYLIQFLDFKDIYIGLPNPLGLATFKKLKASKINYLFSLADDENISIGDLLFDRMIDSQECDNSFFDEIC